MAGDRHQSGQAGGREPIAVIRYANGHVDDVAIQGDLFRMEQMRTDAWWAAIYRGNKRTAFWLEWNAESQNIVATVTEDGIGCVDDSKRGEVGKVDPSS